MWEGVPEWLRKGLYSDDEPGQCWEPAAAEAAGAGWVLQQSCKAPLSYERLRQPGPRVRNGRFKHRSRWIEKQQADSGVNGSGAED